MNEIERITSFWLSQMWSSEGFGRVTPENLLQVIQDNSAHPRKGDVTLDDCKKAMQAHAAHIAEDGAKSHITSFDDLD